MLWAIVILLIVLLIVENIILKKDPYKFDDRHHQ